MRMQKCLYIRDVLTDHQYEEGLGIQRGVGVGMGHHRQSIVHISSTGSCCFFLQVTYITETLVEE